MKTGKMVVMALFALLVFGIIFVAAQESKAPVVSTSASDDVYKVVKPMGYCNYFCSVCLKFGHNGACTASGACC